MNPAFDFRRRHRRLGTIVFRGRDGKAVLDSLALQELRGAITRAAQAKVSVVTVESEVPRLFAAGADLKCLLRLRPEEASELARDGQATLVALAKLPALTIALVDGAALGGGLDLALACDLRFATAHARFGHPGVKLGIVTGWGGTARLPRLVGQAAAARMFYEGEAVAAAEALVIGLVDQVGSIAELHASSERIAASAALSITRGRARPPAARRRALARVGLVTPALPPRQDFSPAHARHSK